LPCTSHRALPVSWHPLTALDEPPSSGLKSDPCQFCYLAHARVPCASPCSARGRASRLHW